MNQPSYRRKQKDAVSWLNQSSHGASLLATVRHHVELQQRLQAVLPAPWGAACSVMRWQDQVLTLGVPNAAHAAKIRQLTPSLTAGLRQVGWQVNGIRVRVQAGEPVETEAKRLAMRPPREVRPLDRHDLEAFEALGSTLPDGPLAQSVARLLARHHVPPEAEDSASPVAAEPVDILPDRQADDTASSAQPSASTATHAGETQPSDASTEARSGNAQP